MAVCRVCEKELSFIENVLALKTKRCKDCDINMKQVQQQTLNTIEQSFRQNGISSQMEQDIYQQFNKIKMPQDLGAPVIRRLTYLRPLSEIRWGNIPIIRTDIHLDSDEHAHFDIPATYYKPNKNIKIVPGRLIGTNKKCYFLSHSGKDNATIEWNNVSKVTENRAVLPQSEEKNGMSFPIPIIHLTVSKGGGGGNYKVPDTFMTKILMDTLVRLWKRQLVLYKESNTLGAIPQHIKNAVFQRDKGKCVQCGYQGDYIEFDHVIPRSKGGPNTVENVQLLCRKCNLQKGNRL